MRPLARQPRPSRRTRTGWTLAAAVLLLLGVAAASQGQEDRVGLEAARSLERALTGVVERCEASVVSISLQEGQPVLMSDDASDAARALQRQIILQRMQRQRQLPGGLAPLSQPLQQVSPADGAGVVIDPKGLILTEYSVVELDKTHVVTDTRGQRYVAQIRAADPRSGLAVLAIQRRLPQNGGDNQNAGDRSSGDRASGDRSSGDKTAFDLPALPLGQAEDLRKGRFVIAIGNPFSIESDGQPTASWGTVTNTALRVPDGESLGDSDALDGEYQTTLHHHGSLIQTDAKLGWNSSGGALVDLDGRLVGLTTTAAAIAGHEQPAGYAIPINEAMRRVIATLRDGRAPEYGLLGVTFSPGTARSPLTGQIGIAVRDAFRGGPAARAGLRAQDLLLSIGGRRVTSPDALQLVVGSLAPGVVTAVSYERNGRSEDAEVRLGKAYVGQGQIVSRAPRSWRGIQVDFPTAIPPEALGVAAVQGKIDPEGCVVVSDVDPASDSWGRGIRPYVYISHVNGERVETPDEFYAAVEGLDENVRLKFTQPLPNNPVANAPVANAPADQPPPPAQRRPLPPPTAPARR